MDYEIWQTTKTPDGRRFFYVVEFDEDGRYHGTQPGAIDAFTGIWRRSREAANEIVKMKNDSVGPDLYAKVCARLS